MTVYDFSLGVVDRSFDTKLGIDIKSFILEDMLGVGDTPYFLMAGEQKNQKKADAKKVSQSALTLDFADVSFRPLFEVS